MTRINKLFNVCCKTFLISVSVKEFENVAQTMLLVIHSASTLKTITMASNLVFMMSIQIMNKCTKVRMQFSFNQELSHRSQLKSKQNRRKKKASILILFTKEKQEPKSNLKKVKFLKRMDLLRTQTMSYVPTPCATTSVSMLNLNLLPLSQKYVALDT